MSFLRNTWYCAAWAVEVTQQPFKRTILNEPIAFFRTEKGLLVALDNRCPHRYASLAKGKVMGDSLQCPYHGLEFGADGRCTKNPQGDGEIPKGCKVKSYAVVEKQGVIWIWMGEPKKAVANQIVDIGEPGGKVGWKTVQGYLHVKANYQLISDNLLNLTHVAYLHPLLTPDLAALPENFEELIKIKQEGETLWTLHWNNNCPVTPLMAMVWEHTAKLGTLRAHMRWDAPSILYLDTGMHANNETEQQGVCMPSSHLLTPETEHSTHYFWLQARNKQIDNEGLSDAIRAGIAQAFECEDEPMIEDCSEQMPSIELMALTPVFLQGDGAGMRARRLLMRKIEDELASAVT